MKTNGNMILITGGGSGIGRALAEAFHKLGNQVIIAGRGKKTLDETTAANPGMKSVTLDVSDPKSIQSFAAQVTKDFPTLNVIIFFRSGLCAVGNDTHLLRDQSRHPFLHPIAPLPAQGDKRGSDRTHTALRADHAHGRFSRRRIPGRCH